MIDQKLQTFNTKVMPLIYWENARQIQRWGTQDHDPYCWFTILSEEVGELAQAILQSECEGIPHQQIVKEAIQTATLAIKIAEMYLAEIGDQWERSADMSRAILGGL